MRLAPLSAIPLLWLVLTGTAAAEDAAKAPTSAAWAGLRSGAALVVVVADEPTDAASSRLERDLRSLGFAVILLNATPENSSDTAALERTARELGGVAAVHMLANSAGSELWLFEPATSQTVTRSLPRANTAAAEPSEIALGTLELLRASMMEVHPQARPVTTAAPPTPKPIDHSEPRPATFSLSGALAAELGLRSVGPSVSTLWAVWLRFGGCFGVRGFAALPLSAEAEELPEGRVEIEPSVLGVGVHCSFASGASRFWPRVGLGFAAAHVVTRGTAVDRTRSSDGAAWLGGGYGLLGLGARLARDVRANLDVTAVVLPTPAVVVASQREIGTWGAPGAIVSLGVEVMSGP